MSGQVGKVNQLKSILLGCVGQSPGVFIGAEVVNSYDKADYVLKPYKAESEKEISLLDENFFMDR